MISHYPPTPWTQLLSVHGENAATWQTCPACPSLPFFQHSGISSSGSCFSCPIQCEAPKIAKLACNSSNYMVYGTYNELVTGANLNQQTSRRRGPHIVCFGRFASLTGMQFRLSQRYVTVQSNPPVDRFATDSIEKGVQRQIKAVPVASNSKSQREAIHVVSIYIYIYVCIYIYIHIYIYKQRFSLQPKE